MPAAPLTIELSDLASTVRFAEDLALALRPGDCVCLSGDLGAGKSTFARAVIRAIADDPELEAPSPTFTLVQSYALRVPLAHFDLYRIGSPDEIEELGLDDALADGAALIEWPERALEALPDERVMIRLEGFGDTRTANITAPPDFLNRLDRSLAARRFLVMAGHARATRRHLQGDASSRTYETVHLPDGPAGQDRLILMDAPRRPDGEAIRDGLPYSRIAHLAEDVTPFVAIAGWLRHQGFAAPTVLAQDLDAGFLLVEHLGESGVLDDRGAPDPERYLFAVDCLATLHAKPPPATLPVEDRVHEVPAYDARAMQIEVELLIDWYLPWRRGTAVPEHERSAYLDHWQSLFSRLASAEKALVLRDYHSPNLIWRGDRNGLERLGLIDFQDAMIGPSAYDLASLCQDARVTVSQNLADRLLRHYADARRRDSAGFDETAFSETYAIMAAQRAAKILGIFVRLDQRDGKPGYLRHLPRMEAYIGHSLQHPALAPLRSWFAQAGIGQFES